MNALFTVFICGFGACIILDVIYVNRNRTRDGALRVRHQSWSYWLFNFLIALFGGLAAMLPHITLHGDQAQFDNKALEGKTLFEAVFLGTMPQVLKLFAGNPTDQDNENQRGNRR